MTVPAPEPSDLVAADIIVSGNVQGVGYRVFAQRAADVLQVSGWVRNLPGGRVQVEAEGPRANIEEFLARLRVGPRLSSVTEMSATWKTASGTLRGFAIKP